MAEKEQESVKKKNPYDLLTKEVVSKVFIADKGDSSVLSTFEIKDFTKKGDNYASIVTGITCHGTCEGVDVVGKYVVKINPCRDMKMMEDFIGIMFYNEGHFFLDALPKLNEAIQPLGISLDFFPHCLYATYEKDQELLFTKDLRCKGFKMSDRTKGMGDDETMLVLTALAKFHSSSYIMKCDKKSSLGELLPFLKENIFLKMDQSEQFKEMMKINIDQSSEMLESVNYNSNAINWLRDCKDHLVKLYYDSLTIHEEKFQCILHGDFWNNNMVFRYDENEHSKPVEVILLDLQICHLGSVAIDINYFLYSSLKGCDRKNNLEKYLNLYYDEFSKVVNASDFKMPFDLHELKEEHKRTVVYGALQGMSFVSIMLAEDDEVIDVDKINDDNMDEFMKEWKENNLRMLSTKVAFKEKFLSIFDDLEFFGLFDSDKKQEN